MSDDKLLELKYKSLKMTKAEAEQKLKKMESD